MKNFTRQSKTASSGNNTDLFVSARFRTEELRELRGPALSVLLAYRSHANAEGLAWPSRGALAKTTGYGINAVKAARSQLVAAGYLIPVEQVREGGEFGRKVFKVSTVGHKPCHGTAVPSTVAPSTVGHKPCQEGSPAQGSPSKGNPVDAVRRRFDAEQRADRTPPFREKLQNRLEKKIESTNDSYPDWIKSCIKTGEDHPFGAEEQQAFEATGYKPDLSSSLLGFDFVTTVVDVYEETRKKDLLPGNLCSRIIDRCQSERERNDGEGYYWPPDFQDHRDRLRVQERARELMSANKVSHAGSGVRP